VGKVAVKYFESDFVEKQYITVFKETLISFNNKQQWPIGKWTKSDSGPLESERNPTLCYEKCWPNFLSEATFSRTNFWLIIFSFLLHKILALVFNMFIYAKVGQSKFVEMHRDASDFYQSALIFYTRHWVNITIYRTVYLHTDKCMCKC
jgi:hypothetical protein